MKTRFLRLLSHPVCLAGHLLAVLGLVTSVVLLVQDILAERRASRADARPPNGRDSLAPRARPARSASLQGGGRGLEGRESDARCRRDREACAAGLGAAAGEARGARRSGGGRADPHLRRGLGQRWRFGRRVSPRRRARREPPPAAVRDDRRVPLREGGGQGPRFRPGPGCGWELDRGEHPGPRSSASRPHAAVGRAARSCHGRRGNGSPDRSRRPRRPRRRSRGDPHRRPTGCDAPLSALRRGERCAGGPEQGVDRDRSRGPRLGRQRGARHGDGSDRLQHSGRSAPRDAFRTPLGSRRRSRTSDRRGDRRERHRPRPLPARRGFDRRGHRAPLRGAVRDRGRGRGRVAPRVHCGRPRSGGPRNRRAGRPRGFGGCGHDGSRASRCGRSGRGRRSPWGGFGRAVLLRAGGSGDLGAPLFDRAGARCG